MNKRKHKLVNIYLNEVLLANLKKMDCKFVGGDFEYWTSENNVAVMIEGSTIKLSKKVWIELTDHFSLNVNDVHMVMSGWIKENLGINRKLTMANCSFMRKI